jgi:hypothetical protein
MVDKLTPALLDPHHRAHRRLWELLARTVYAVSDIERDAFIARRRGLAKVQTRARAALDIWFKDSLSSEAARGYVFESLLAARWLRSSWDPKFRPEFEELCELAGVDLKALVKDGAPK